MAANAARSTIGGEYAVAADEITPLTDSLARQPHCFVVVASNKLRIGGDPIIDRREGIAGTQAAQSEFLVGARLLRPSIVLLRALACRLSRVFPAHMRAECMTCGKNSERLAIIRIDTDRLFQQRLRHDIVLPRYAPVMRQRPHHQIPGVHAVWRFALGVKILRGIELWLDGGDDGFSDLILNCENVCKSAIVSFRPDVAASGDVVELCRDADTVAAFAHAALDDVTDTEFRCYLFQMDSFALIGE
jgi:hypothetical protein